MDDIEIFVADWDETITSQDTMRLIGDAAYSEKPDFEPKWQYFIEAYMQDYEKYCSQISSRKTLQEEYDFLTGLKGIENASAKRVEQSGLFNGVPQGTILNQAHKVPIRPGWWEVFGKLRARGVPVMIISVNWSAKLIQQVFKNKGYSDIEVPKIYANDIEMDANGIGTGVLCGAAQLRTAADKASIMDQIREQHADKRLYYFGDSSTDLMALMKADVGVVVHKRKLLDTSAKLGVSGLRYINDWHCLLNGTI